MGYAAEKTGNAVFSLWIWQQSTFLNLMAGVVLEPDQRGGKAARAASYFWMVLAGGAMRPSGRGDFSVSNFHLGPIPENLF